MAKASDFRAFYDSELAPVLERLDGERRKIMGRMYTVGIVGVVLTGAAAAFVGLTGGSQVALVIAIVGALVTGLALGLTWWLTASDFKPRFKDQVIGSIARFCDPTLRYQPEMCISQGTFSSSRIFLTGIDRYKGEDYVSGTIGETGISFSEVHAEYKTTTHTKNGTRTHWHTIFKGLFFVADFNKDFKGATVILPDVAEAALGWLGQKLQEWNFTRSEELVKLEDADFERQFVVYGDDQIEARYILSSSLMQRILDLQRRVDCEVYLSFVRSKVYVAVKTGRDLFEPTMHKSLVDYNLAKEYLWQLELALGIVEDLDLNTRIWSKE